MSLGPNNAFKPKPLRSTKHMAGKACHVVGYATQVGLTQALELTMRLVAILLVFMLASCSSEPEPTIATTSIESPTQPQPETYVGYYIFGFERSEFVPQENREESWWLSGRINCDVLTFNQERFSPWGQVYVEIQGVVSPVGHYGHMGFYKREITLTNTVSCRTVRDGEGVEL